VWFLDYQLSVAVAVGLIALAGVAIEISVLMLMYLNQSLNDNLDGAGKNVRISSESLREAIISGALLRLRPIIMTAATIVIGLFPIMLGQGVGSEIMQRIAAPMVGGMVTTLLLTLCVIPALFLIWQRRGLDK